jgi:A/G-specific adenine glycosylase
MKASLDVSALRAALLAAYDRDARDLPWRRDTDPYRILVSEVMLQQTRVETVTGYYDAWLDRFPSTEALASASEDEVLKAWEGLGYYRRARNLHRAARMVREELGGQIPTTVEGLRQLPGVGEYTAGAVASIAFAVPAPAVDGNVTRVLARLFDEPGPRPAWLRETAAALVDPERPGDWNQALMELGATVCTPRSPKCDACPVSDQCAARAAGTQLERPEPKPARPTPRAVIALAVIHDGRRVLLERRARGGLLGGMWAFPEHRLSDETDPKPAAERAVQALVVERDLDPVDEPVELPECRHRFTHLDARYRPWAIEVRRAPRHREGRRARDADGRTGGERAPDGPDRAWVDPTATGERALPKAQRLVLASWLEHSRAPSC